LRSSGSDDFVWDIFRDLADLYVDIDPILVPPRGRIQFYVADPEVSNDQGIGEGRRESEGEGIEANGDNKPKKHRPNPNVKKVRGAVEGSHAAVFYENFFNCANAIKTGDYSMYLPPPSSPPTLQPTVSRAPSMASSIANMPNETSNDDTEGNLGLDGALDAQENGDNQDAPSLEKKWQ